MTTIQMGNPSEQNESSVCIVTRKEMKKKELDTLK